VKASARGRPPRLRAITLVAVAAAAISGLLIGAMISGVDPDRFDGRRPYARLYDGDRTQLEAFLVTGDAQAYATLAQDPLLTHPENVDPPAEYSYRAQRAVWGYLAWAASIGQPDLAGWALVALAIVASGVAAAVIGALAVQRGCSPWWGLVVIAAGVQALAELAPEIFATALVGLAVMQLRDRRHLAIGLLCVAALTRESMLVAVGAVGLYELVVTTGSFRERVRSTLPFALPFAAYLTWTAVLYERLGTWAWTRGENRLVAPFSGIVKILETGHLRTLTGPAIAVALCATAWAFARRDVLTWIATAFLGYATMFSADVWLRGGYQRTLVPLFVFGTVAVVGGWRARSRTLVDAAPAPSRATVAA